MPCRKWPQLLGHYRRPEIFREVVQPGLILGLELNQILDGFGPAPGLGPLVLRAAVAHARRRLSSLEPFPVAALALRVAQSHGRYVTGFY